MIHRQLVNVWAAQVEQGKEVVGKTGSVVLPAVFSTGIRTDIVNFAHMNMNKNRKQGHAVKYKAGMRHSAESWGTGRAVSRIPRVSGSGTQRSGQAAFGNMCRKGRMFAPIRIWRRWHRRTNLKQRRFATATAVASSAILPLVQARGHRVDRVPELPLVIDNKVEAIERTREAVRFLKAIGAFPDVKKVVDAIQIRAGRGKARNRRYRTRKGPLVVYSGANVPLVKALRNVPGVETVHVSRLNLLQLAPGGHVGRFVIWTQGSFEELNKIFGSTKFPGTQKKGYTLPRNEMTNPDLARVINSNEIQSALRPVKRSISRSVQKRNPLKNTKAMDTLNPNARTIREAARKANEENRKKRQTAIKEKRALSGDQKKHAKLRTQNSRKWIGSMTGQLNDTHKLSVEQGVRLKKLERQIE